MPDRVAKRPVGANADRAGAAVEVLGGWWVAQIRVGARVVGQVEGWKRGVGRVTAVTVQRGLVLEQLLILVVVLLHIRNLGAALTDFDLRPALSVLRVG